MFRRLVIIAVVIVALYLSYGIYQANQAGIGVDVKGNGPGVHAVFTTPVPPPTPEPKKDIQKTIDDSSAGVF